jgi:hypothetical protein
LERAQDLERSVAESEARAAGAMGETHDLRQRLRDVEAELGRLRARPFAALTTSMLRTPKRRR